MLAAEPRAFIGLSILEDFPGARMRDNLPGIADEAMIDASGEATSRWL